MRFRRIKIFILLFSTEAELDFVSGISEAELTDSEIFKPSLAHAHSGHLDVDSKGLGASMLSPVAEESSNTSGKRSSERGTAHTYGEAPRFIKTPSNMMKLVEGATIRLDCVISGTPDPKVTWSRNGIWLQNGPRYTVIEDPKNSKFYGSFLKKTSVLT